MPQRASIEVEIREGTRVLERAGVLNPEREATAIWAVLSACSPGDVWLRKQEEAPAAMSARFREALRRRASGEPLPYVVGSTGFRTLDLKIDSRALIPRPETEGLVEQVLRWAVRRYPIDVEDWGVAVDVGTGSGCVALSLAVEGRFKRIIATDESEAALSLTKENVMSIGPSTPVDLRHGSLLEPIGSLIPDVIVSNPPYVTEAEFATLDAAVRNFEPRIALVSGEGGMKHTRGLLEAARRCLALGGLLAIEVDSTRAEAVLELGHQIGWQNACLEDDIFGRSRFFLATKET